MVLSALDAQKDKRITREDVAELCKVTPAQAYHLLKKITKDNANAKAQWIEIRTYLVGQQANDLFKDHDDVSIYNQLIEHYKTLKAQTKFQLHKTYTRITEIITETYKVARP